MIKFKFRLFSIAFIIKLLANWIVFVTMSFLFPWQTGTVDCETCQRLTVFYQLSFNLLRVICPRLESSLPVLDIKQLVAQNSATPDIIEESESGSVPVIHTLFVTLLQVRLII